MKPTDKREAAQSAEAASGKAPGKRRGVSSRDRERLAFEAGRAVGRAEGREETPSRPSIAIYRNAMVFTKQCDGQQEVYGFIDQRSMDFTPLDMSYQFSAEGKHTSFYTGRVTDSEEQVVMAQSLSGHWVVARAIVGGAL